MRTTKKVLALIILFCVAFSIVSPVFGDPLTDSEQQALINWPNWVGQCGSGVPDTNNATAGSPTAPVTDSSTPKNGQPLGGVAGTGFTQAEIDKAKQLGGSAHFSGADNFLATTYGPPWDAVEGGGTTSTGLSLAGPDNSHGRPRYEIAVDPSVIPYGSLVTVWPNAVNWRGPFLAADTGGAIKNHHVDVYDWSGDGTKDSFSAPNAKVEPYTGSLADAGPASTNTQSDSQGNCCSASQSSQSSQQTATGSIDISQIATKYKLQSAIIQGPGGNTIANYHADEPPSTPASTMKLIIADTTLRSGVDLNKTVRVGSDVYYAGGNDLGVSSISLGNALKKMLEVSSNVGANVLMKELGGVNAFTQKAHSYGYTHTTVGGFYDPSNDGKNSSTISDEAAAMSHIFSTTGGGGYGLAQNALQYAAQNDNYYGVDDIANKWAGTSTVAGNVGNFKINGKDYIIGLYFNGSDTSSEAKTAIKSGSADLVSAIQGASTSQASGSGSGTTACCTNTTDSVPAGTLPAFIPEPYNGAFTQGANNHTVAPALVAALFSEEHNLGGSETDPNTRSLPAAWASFVKSQPNPNSGWAGSSAGAQGPFQFLPSTFTSLGYDVKDINNLVKSADAAAKYAQTDGATKDKPTNQWKSFIYSYNHADWYVNAVLKYYNYYNSQPSATPGAPTPVASPDTSNTGCASSGGKQQVVSIAQQELALWKSGKMTPGFRRNSPDSFSKYSQNSDELWCADFVSWVYKQAGTPLRQGSGWNISWVPDVQSVGLSGQGFQLHTKSDGYTPQPGDIAIYGGSHTNLLVSVSGNTTTYIGGDQGGPPYPDGSKVTTYTGNGYYDNGVTAYVALDQGT